MLVVGKQSCGSRSGCGRRQGTEGTHLGRRRECHDGNSRCKLHTVDWTEMRTDETKISARETGRGRGNIFRRFGMLFVSLLAKIAAALVGLSCVDYQVSPLSCSVLKRVDVSIGLVFDEFCVVVEVRSHRIRFWIR